MGRSGTVLASTIIVRRRHATAILDASVDHRRLAGAIA